MITIQCVDIITITVWTQKVNHIMVSTTASVGLAWKDGRPELCLASLHHLQLQLFLLLPLALFPKRRGQVVHVSQRRGMIYTIDSLLYFENLSNCILGPIPSSVFIETHPIS